MSYAIVCGAAPPIVLAVSVHGPGTCRMHVAPSQGRCLGAGSKAPLVIGASVSLTGDFADSGKAVKAGYELWADTVNAKGGILGRQVEMKIVDDTSSPTQVVTNYQNLINKDKVDLVFGPFSSLLTVPASQVAKRYGVRVPRAGRWRPRRLRAEPGQPLLRPAGPGGQVRRRVRRLGAVAAGRARPKTAAYAELDDPFAAPIAETHPNAVRGGRNQDRVQAGVSGRDAGLLSDHGQGRCGHDRTCW